MKTINKRVALEPFPEIGVRVTVKAGVSQIQQKGSLVKLRVVYDTADNFLRAGDYAYLRGDFSKDTRFQPLTAADGTKFMLVPIELIDGVEQQKPFQGLTASCQE